MNQTMVRRLSSSSHVALLCGRYEGIDDRVRSLVDEEISVGDYILAGGEPAAWVVMDAVSRLVPGVVGRSESVAEESFSEPGLLEYPQYTRPREFRGQAVPEVLCSGDHATIARWRRRQSLLRTAHTRPDLLSGVELSADERAWLNEQR
jgi:tRNA (guanine37-N1)-methyltransferase